MRQDKGRERIVECTTEGAVLSTTPEWADWPAIKKLGQMDSLIGSPVGARPLVTTKQRVNSLPRLRKTLRDTMSKSGTVMARLIRPSTIVIFARRMVILQLLTRRIIRTPGTAFYSV